MEDWLSRDPILRYEPTVYRGRWVPGLEIYSEEKLPDGWLQKFVVHDGTNNGRYPVERSGTVRQNLTDPDFLISQWKSVPSRACSSASSAPCLR